MTTPPFSPEQPFSPEHPFSIEHQRRLIADIAGLSDERARAEIDIESRYRTRLEDIEQSFRTRSEELTAAHEAEYEATNAEYTDALSDARRVYETELEAAQRDREETSLDIGRSRDKAVSQAQRKWKRACRDAESRFQREIAKALGDFKEFSAQCEQRRGQLHEIQRQAEAVLRRRGCPAALDPGGEAEPACTDPRPLERFERLVAEARDQLNALNRLPAARFIEEGWPVLLFVFAWLAAVYPAGEWLSWRQWYWIAASGGAATIATVLIYLVVQPFRKKGSLRRAPALRQTIAEANSALNAALRSGKTDLDKTCAAIAERRETTISQSHAEWSRLRNEATSEHEASMGELAEKNETRRNRAELVWDSAVRTLKSKYPPLLAQMTADVEQAARDLQQQHDEQLQHCQREHQQSWSDLIGRWRAGMARLCEDVDGMNDFCDRRFPDWSEIDWAKWSPPTEELPALRFGRYPFDLEMLANGISEDDRLAVERTDFSLPAFLTFPERPSLLLESEGEGRDVATGVIQNVMLRLLTSLPAGKVRFTIIDPVGLGQNFSAFMHLADYDERLVTNRIWTEPAHIKQRLADLTEHMENVIQKYLRNEFESIQQYNRSAGEVAEPFQILVAANFPAGFNEETARRLTSIAASGARCGVYTLISTDRKLQMPRNFDLADLEAHASVVEWSDGSYFWKDENLNSLPLEVDKPPGDEVFTQAMRAAGQLAKEATRVEVPFATVAPAIDHWWAGDSRDEIDAPLGRAGATKLQHMRLGKGTSQHVLISGKTGSGKSTLLHAMITNLAIHYNPDELHFYLIDFKKGVEFKPYAQFGLPHARVIAIESEREFGMSVLERLDAELRRRGDLFRSAGAQDVRAYRDANPDASMPRVMLIIDEFQEFFTKDDKISQEASLLLDRLVRQGRAFGIHVVLGSQTLAGAYSLARSTIGQMAVRIALQCSEADAHLILSEDNTAARLLGRPGEAIYNNANGLFEGNNPFQVVWLPDSERESYLQRIDQLARQRHTCVAPPIVFEGNVPADVGENLQLREALETPPGLPASRAPRVWLGAAVAIKEPTEAVFHRHSGANLLVVGQQEPMAMGVLGSALVSLAASQPTTGAARFFVFDGTRPESPDVDFWPRVADRLPLDLQRVGPRKVDSALAEIAAEVDRRLQQADDTGPPIFLTIYNLSRFRNLKASEDDYSFSSIDDDQPKRSDKLLAHILREGPPWGVHTLVWSDSYNNAVRWLGRQTLRDLELRVLFQMGGGDSSNLMDSPAASQLGAHRAYFYSDESGQYEKFRPYAAPTDQWLAWVREQLQGRKSGARIE